MNVKLKPDKVLRDRFYTAESYQHPAKGHLGLWWEILERYTREGETILDPMAGVGATMLGALMGRNVICVEMESHFVSPMLASWEKMRQSPMLGHTMGQVVILRGDARCLPIGRADAVITSPPFQDQLAAHDPRWFEAHRSEFGGGAIPGSSYTRPSAIITSPPYEMSDLTKPLDGTTQGNATHKAGLQRRYTRPPAQVDTVVTSPPYEGVAVTAGDQARAPSIKFPDGERTDRGKIKRDGLFAKGYTRPVDAVVTSPPYDEGLGHGGKPSQRDVDKALWGRVAQNSYNHRTKDNIGNLRGPAYWEAMRQVYAECHRVLKPGGLMVLVVKGFVRAGIYQDLPLLTRQLCETLGFRFVETWRRELWSLSFWRILQQRRDPAAFDSRLRFEEVLVLERSHGPL